MNARVCISKHQTGCQIRLADETGTIAIEYGLLAALVALVILGTLRALGVSLASLPLQLLVDAMQAAIS